MTLLSVNVNKIATLRNSRGKDNPNVLKVALDCIRFGAHGITVHPRPDERHIRFSDVRELKKHLNVELNVEGYPSEEFLKLIEEVRPAQATLVPDPPEAITSNAGWDLIEHLDFLKVVVERLHKTGCRTSLFIDPKDFIEPTSLKALKEIGTDRIELYTEAYAESFDTPEQQKVLETYKNVAQICDKFGVEVNAGHDLNLKNLKTLLLEVGVIKEVSIGHALVCDALYMGLESTIKKYLQQLPS